jgi:hypothetical protein
MKNRRIQVLVFLSFCFHYFFNVYLMLDKVKEKKGEKNVCNSLYIYD